MLPGKDSVFAIELAYLFVTLLRVSPKASGAANWLLLPQVAQILCISCITATFPTLVFLAL